MRKKLANLNLRFEGKRNNMMNLNLRLERKEREIKSQWVGEEDDFGVGLV